MNKLMQTLDELIVSEFSNLIMRFTKLSIVLFFVTHWNACLFYAIGNSRAQEEGNSWLLQVGCYDSSVQMKYVNALYWSFTTMMSVGYGDIRPTTTTEREVVMMCMILSSGVFAFIIGDIGKMVGSFNELAA